MTARKLERRALIRNLEIFLEKSRKKKLIRFQFIWIFYSRRYEKQIYSVSLCRHFDGNTAPSGTPCRTGSLALLR